MFEIGYLTMGRSSIFAICMVILINSFFLIIIFVLVFGNTSKSFVTNISGCTPDVAKTLTTKAEVGTCGTMLGIFGHPYIYSVIISVLLLPTTFMKEIAELHLVAMSLFGSALLFVVINIV